VGVGLLAQTSVFGTVAEYDLAVLLQAAKRVAIRVVLALAVRDGHLEDLSSPHSASERRLAVLDEEIRGLTAVLQALVPHQRAREQRGLAEDLKAVARAEHEPTRVDEVGQGGHDGRASGNGAGAQVVSVRKSAWQDQAVEPLEVRFAVPHVAHGLPEHLTDDV